MRLVRFGPEWPGGNQAKPTIPTGPGGLSKAALVWDIRAGIVPLHRHQPDPLDKVAGSPLRLVSATPWRWPWRLSITQRIELVSAETEATAAAT